MKQIKELPKDGKFVVLFTSDHCPHCKKMEKNLKQIEKKYSERGIEFYSINISRNQEIALKYNIMSVPFTIFMNGNKLVGKESGAVSIKTIELELEELLKDGEFIKKLKRLFRLS